MFLRPALNATSKTTRLLSTDSVKGALNEAATLKKQDYYKSIGQLKEDEVHAKPPEWDGALPYESIPGPKPYPIVGNVVRFLPKIGNYYGLDLVELNKTLNKEYGEIVLVRNIDGFNRDLLSVFSPEYIELVFRSDGIWPKRLGLGGFDYYRRHVRKDVFQGKIGVGTSQGKEWFDFRSTVNPILMNPRSSELYVDKIDAIATEFLGKMKKFAERNPHGEMPEDFHNELNKFALESIGVTALDTRLGCLNENLSPDSDAQMFINKVNEFFELMYEIEVLPNLWRYFSTPKWKRYVEVMDYLVFSALKYIESANLENLSGIDENELSMIQRLIKLDKRIAIAMAIDMLQAGVDTTSKTLATTLYYLAKNPNVQAELREETKKLLPTPDTPITKDTLKNAPYVKAVIKESQRISPIVIGTARILNKDMVIGGYRVPKGTEVLTANQIISRMEKYFPKAEEFVPERWLRSTTDEMSHKNVHPFVSLPFGFGPRSCVGKRIALMELEIMLTKIIRNFELAWPHKDVTFRTTILHGIADPLKLHVKRVTT